MNKRAFLILAISIFGSMLGQGIVSPFLPLYSESMGATGLWVGLIFGAFSYSRLVVMPFVGPLSDRRGRKLFLCIGLALYAIISLGYISANSLYHLILVRLVQGAASAVILPIARAYIGDLCPEGEEGIWQGYANAAFFGGFAGGPLLGGVLADQFGATVAFATMGGLNLLAFLLALFALPEVSRPQVAIRHLSFKEMSVSRTVWGLLSFRMTYAVSRATFMTFVSIFASSTYGSSKTLIGILLATHMGLMAAIQPYVGHLADRFSKRALVIIGGVINTALLALIPLMSNYGQLLVLCAVGGLGAALSLPPVEAMAVDEGRKYGMGTAMSALMMAMSVGMAVGPTVSGAIADALNISYAFYFCAVMGLIGTALFMWLTSKASITSPLPTPKAPGS